MKLLAPFAGLALLASLSSAADRARWDKTATPERPAGEVTKGGEDIRAGGETIGGAGIGQGGRDQNGGASKGTGGSGSGGGGGGGASTQDSGGPVPRFDKVRVYVSNSKTGPWRENGEACRNAVIYTRTTGVDKKDPPKGCASPAASRYCLEPRNNRVYEEKEWVDRNTLQTEMAPGTLPQGKYAGYLAYGSDVRRVGTIAVRDCPTGELPNPFPNAKVSVSNSAKGPFKLNGSARACEPLYARMTGVTRGNPPLGCASPMDETFCWERKNFRTYTEKEWLDVRTIQTDSPSNAFPPNRYAFYAANARGEIQFVGFAALDACGGAVFGPAPAPAPAPEPVLTCGWKALGAVFGPCSSPKAYCAASVKGATTNECGAPWVCDCGLSAAPPPTPAPAPTPAPPPAPAPSCAWRSTGAVFGPCNPPPAGCSAGQTTTACGGPWVCDCSGGSAPAPAPAPAPPAQRGCMWETHDFVVGPCNGPGCNANAFPCGVSNAGATGQGGGGTWTCTCR